MSNFGTRTGHTPEQKEKVPEKLEDKTGKLEKRLLLRHCITKALAIKRAEISELAGRGDAEQLPPSSSPGSTQRSPQKLTFYDVVQLARQQALAEKTRKSNEDLIDLSEMPQLVMKQESSTSAQHDLDLLECSNPMAPQEIDQPSSSQYDTGTPKAVQDVDPTSNQPEIIEFDASSHQPTSVADLLELVEFPASQADHVPGSESIEALASPFTAVETAIQQNLQTNQSRDLLSDEKRPALEPISSETSLIVDSDIKEILESCTSPLSLDQPSISGHQSDTALIDHLDETDETLTENSPISTAAPSIFSHSSSLTSATGCSLPGITEEDLQARIISSRTSMKSVSIYSKHTSLPARKMVSGSAVPSISESQAGSNVDQPEKSPSTGHTPVAQTDLELLSKPQRAQSGDTVSISPSLPQISNIDEPDEHGLPWIVQAARDGDEELIRKLLVSGADIKAIHTSTNRHALSEASIQGHRNAVDLLIAEGCPLEFPDAEGNTALHHACRTGHLAVAKSLITSGAIIDALGPQRQSPLHLAMLGPHQNVVMLLIQNKASVDARDAGFRTPLHIGSSQGNVAMCDYLLTEGAQLDSREAQSKTPLQIACEAGYYDLVQMMLNRSSLNTTSMTFLTAFFAAVEHGHVRIAEAFFTYGLKLSELKKDSYKPATIAAKSGSLAMVELMIREDCEVNTRDENGWNALHFAANHGHYQVIERLLASDVSASATTSRKETPLLFAAKGGNFAVAERLLRSDQAGNLVSAEDEQGQQPVHHTVRAGSIEIFNLLMSNGGKINVANAFGWQPIHIATAYGHLALVERLLQQGASIEEKLGSSSIKKDQTHKIVEEGYWAEARWPYPGSRPLHLACEYGHERIVNYLISKGAKMEATCSEGWQPLHHAAYFGSFALVKVLLEGGVNPHATTNEGKTAQALDFCTSGTPILEEQKEQVKSLLRAAMEKTRKQKTFKVPLKRGSTVEEKNKLVRAATFSMDLVSRPPLHRAMTVAPTSDSALPHVELPHSDSGSSLYRPRLTHLPHTSPFPSTEVQSVMNSHLASTPHLLVSKAEAEAPGHSNTTNSNLESTETPTPESSKAPTLTSNTTKSVPSSTAEISTPKPTPTTTETQVSLPPEPKLKRRTTFGLAKVKPGLDISKLTLVGSMSKPAFELGKQTLDIGKQTLEITNKTLELGKVGLEISKVGLEISKAGLEKRGKQGFEKSKLGFEKSKQGLEAIQGLEVGKQGISIGKQGYKKAKRFAKKKGGKLRGKEKVGGDVGVSVEGSVGFGDGVDKDKYGPSNPNGDDGDNNDDDDDDDDDGNGSDGAGSVFSLGEFADLGNDDF